MSRRILSRNVRESGWINVLYDLNKSWQERSLLLWKVGLVLRGRILAKMLPCDENACGWFSWLLAVSERSVDTVARRPEALEEICRIWTDVPKYLDNIARILF